MNKKISIFTKVFGGYFLITVLLVTLILLFSFKTIKNYYIDSLTSNMENLGIALKLKFVPLLRENRIAELDVLVKKLGKKLDRGLTIVDQDGVVLSDSDKDPALMENHKNRSEILKALNSKFAKSLRYSFTLDQEMLYVALSLEDEGKRLGVLRVSLFLSDINDLLGNLKMRIIYIALSVVSISLIFALLFSRNLSNPIKKLATGAEKVAFGDFKTRVFLKNNDELKGLADSFNYMTEKVDSLFTDLSLQKDELNSIISSIQAGLFVIDKRGKVVLCNESFRKIVGSDSIKGQYYWKVLRDLKFSDLIRKLTIKKINMVDEVELGSRTFLCSTSFIESKKECVLILHDITASKNLEKMKKDFAVNVSHELRTPLTAIKGFVETLDDEIEQKHKHYLDIIKRHTDRLINIVQDLLILSELEESKLELKKDKVDLGHLVKDVMKMFEQKAEDNGLKLELNLVNECPLIIADNFKLEQVFVNLMDNAIKYTETGGIKVSISSYDKHVVVEFEDSGIGIPTGDLTRIFERFYVVDKSRSRRVGGTGLGLSIVKHIVLLHNGNIEVKNAAVKGTRFIITLPVN